jgi:exodeoxyribonuclease VII large subunit
LQLEEEGLFDAARKRSLPRFPARVGVVTSPVGAVFHDICNVLQRRWPLTEVVLAPTPVQGPEAPLGIVAALESLNLEGDIEVIIVARGGGSIEELWAFNEEAVARAVFGSAAPVVSAVGHETDYTICDYVADLRAPTPSAAAELVAPDYRQIAQQISSGVAGVGASLQRVVEQGRRAAVRLVERASGVAGDRSRLRQRIIDLDRRGLAAFGAGEGRRRERLQRSLAQLGALDPQATLNRGYAVVHKGGRVVNSVTDVATADALVVKVADGGFAARVEAGARRKRAGTTRRNGTAESDGSMQPLLFT